MYREYFHFWNLYWGSIQNLLVRDKNNSLRQVKKTHVCLGQKSSSINERVYFYSDALYELRFKQINWNFHQHIEWSRQRSPTQPLQKEASCRRRVIYPTRELAIFVIFFSIVPIHTYLFFYISIALVRIAHTNVLQKSACQDVQYCSFYGALKIT